MPLTLSPLRCLGLGLALASASCASEGQEETTPPSPTTSDAPPAPFDTVSASSALAKVKGLLIGQAPTAEELQALQVDPKALPGLVDRWMARPEFQAKMLGFFRNAFQQAQVNRVALQDQLGFALLGNGAVQGKLLQNVQDSFPRTVWQLVQEGRPLHEAITTERFLLTPPLATLYAYLDMQHFNDQGRGTNRILQQNPRFSFTLQRTLSIPIEQTLDPQNPNYMKWQTLIPVPAMAMAPCQQDPRVFTGTTQHLLTFLYGAVQGFGGCQQTYAGPAQFADEEFDAWRMVAIRRPAAGEAVTPFYDLRTMRGAKELVLRVPRVGFFSTPAFFANWATNSSNEARVTMNQTLIVALGKSFDDTNAIVPVSENGLSKEHSVPGSPCYSCHRTLDPMRVFFRQAFTLSYHDQLDPTQAAQKGVFAFDGVTREGKDIRDMAQMLAQHPRFARAWTQKLCSYANSAPCIEDDPEFLRVVAAFQQSGYQFPALVRELFSSPLVTALADTKTFQEMGVTVAIARRDHLCAALSNRLGLTDVCGAATLRLSPLQQRARALAALIPADGYSRGAEASTLSNDPNLFFRVASEGLCRIVADQVVDAAGASRYSSKKSEEAISDFVQTVMSLQASEPQAATARQILGEHHGAALASGAVAVDALKSTFVLACMSPRSIGLGL